MVKLAPPWITAVSEMEQMFKYDGEVRVLYNNDDCTVRLYVDSSDKAGALTALLPPEIEFGNVTLKIIVIPANGVCSKLDGANTELLFLYAFDGNPVLSFTKRISGIFTNDLVYVVFAKEVVQYFNDDLGDIYGQCTTLYQEIAKNLFGKRENVFYCTDAEEPKVKLGSALPSWS